MTALLSTDRLCEFARETTQLIRAPERLIVSLQWTIDARTGRPIGRWVLQDETSAISVPAEARADLGGLRMADRP